MSEKVLARDPEHEALLQSQFLFARFGGNFQKRVEDIMEVIINPSPFVTGGEKRRKALEDISHEINSIIITYPPLR